VGQLYSGTGALLAQATFTGETAFGWQQVAFSTPVAIAANATYIAAYFTNSGYADDQGFFGPTGVDNAPLHALRSGVDGQNGVFAYGAVPQFPSQTWNTSNYWVDVAFSSSGAPAPPPPVSGASIWSSSTIPANQLQNDNNPVTLGVKFRSDVGGTVNGVRFYKGFGNNGTHTGLLYTSNGALLAQAAFTGETAVGWQQVAFSSPVAIAANTTYIVAFFTSSGYADDQAYFASKGADSAPLHALRSGVDGLNGVYAYANAPQFPNQSWNNSNYWVDVLFSASGASAPPPPASGSSIWNSFAIPANQQQNDSSPVTLGAKFRSDVSGSVTGVRFFKGVGNNGTHTGMLYTSTGTLLAQATFSGETASGWQQANFSNPVAIAANTTYIVAYFSTTGYADDQAFFASSGADNGVLHALRSGVDGLNGVYAYAGAPQFPTQTWNNSNYWVDVAFTTPGS
jgi:hypothetical protein